MTHTGPIRRSTHRSPGRRHVLSHSDGTSVDFTRCLCQLKAVVRELEAFSESMGPIILLSHGQKAALPDDDHPSSFVHRVYHHFNAMFSKCLRQCRVLLLILDKMELTPGTKRERVHSFRAEVWEQKRLATLVKETVLQHIKRHANLYVVNDSK